MVDSGSRAVGTANVARGRGRWWQVRYGRNVDWCGRCEGEDVCMWCAAESIFAARCGVESWPIDRTNTNAAPQKVYTNHRTLQNPERLPDFVTVASSDILDRITHARFVNGNLDSYTFAVLRAKVSQRRVRNVTNTGSIVHRA